MCIAYIALNSHPDWPLIIAANRDEFHARPTRSAAFWPADPYLLAGQDLQAGGTWLGLHTQHKRISVLTNFREPGQAAPSALSRGKLVSACLQAGPVSDLEIVQTLGREQHRYAGFNLLSLSLHQQPDTGHWQAQAAYLSNRDPTGGQRVPDGIHVLSNHLLNTSWPKSNYLRTHMLSQGFDGSAAAITQLFTVLRYDQPADLALLPQTGLSPEREKLLSSPFIISPDYGTRCSTLVAVHHDGHGLFIERSFDEQARIQAQHDWYFQLHPDL